MDAFFFVFVLPAWVFSFLLATWNARRCRLLLQQWADKNGVTLVEKHYAWFNKGPFSFTFGSMMVYRVVVQDQAGRRWKGWLQCGGYWGALFSDKVEARWDAPSVKDTTLPADEVLLRASNQPPIAQQDVLLRATTAGQEERGEELLRAIGQGESVQK